MHNCIFSWYGVIKLEVTYLKPVKPADENEMWFDVKGLLNKKVNNILQKSNVETISLLISLKLIFLLSCVKNLKV